MVRAWDRDAGIYNNTKYLNPFPSTRPGMWSPGALEPSRWRGPALGGVCLRKTTDFPQTHTRVPIADRQSIHGMPVIAGWIELARRYRTSYQRPPGSNVTSQEMYPSANILAFAVQRTPSQEEME